MTMRAVIAFAEPLLAPGEKCQVSVRHDDWNNVISSTDADNGHFHVCYNNW